jgi:cysteine desulfurase / selenocysteine lyase
MSAHKMYAPFGSGALIGCRDVFARGIPEYRGGGMVEVVTPRRVQWAGLPDREEAGTPNVVGAVAMAVAARTLMGADMDALVSHERALTDYTLERLRSIPGIAVYGRTAPHAYQDRVGVIPFNIDGVHHGLVAAILGYEAGIGVRSGCFCAQGYVGHLLGLANHEQSRRRRPNAAGHRPHRPGMVRLSFGAYNTTEDIDAAVEMLERIGRGDYRGRYEWSAVTGDYLPVGHDDAIRDHFSLETVA